MTESIFQRYGRLLAARDVAKSKSMQLAPQIARELTALETWARANFNSQELARAAQLGAQWQSHYQDQYGKAQRAALEKSGAEAAQAKVRDYAGNLTREQIAARARGEKIEPTKRATQAERDQMIREQTKALVGKGLSESQWAARMNALSEASPQEFEKLAKEYKTEPAKLRAVVDEWDKGEFLEHGLAAKRREREDHKARFNGEEKLEARELPEVGGQRKAQLVETSLRAEADEWDEATQRGEFVRDDSLSNEKIAGGNPMRMALAEAYDKVEANG